MSVTALAMRRSFTGFAGKLPSGYYGILFVNEYKMMYVAPFRTRTALAVQCFFIFFVCAVLVYGLYESEINTE